MANPAPAPPPLCDLVLEGGVTSALIYTGLIARLSSSYQFKRLGGTSAGAAAAAAGAIAQRAKIQLLKKGSASPDEPFQALEKFSQELAKTDQHGRTVLFRLFQAQPNTLRAFRIVTAYLRNMRPGRKGHALLAATASLIGQFPLPAILGAIPGTWMIILVARAYPEREGGWFWASLALGLLLAIGLGLLLAVIWAVVSSLRGLARNHYGLCNGMKGVANSDDKPLTVQLHELFNALLGGAADPVTFGHVWGSTSGEREIDLQVITTALGLRRPFRLPNDPNADPLKEFLYDPNEWKEFFPASVMDWLAANNRLAAGPRIENKAGHALSALPPPAALPVIVAVRLSLSFPGLLSAVPLYTIAGPECEQCDEKSQHVVRRGLEKSFRASKVYFTDGGITSNCPVHLFDAPLPGHPTFGVKLAQLTPDCRHRVWLPPSNREAAPSVRQAPKTGVCGMLGFLEDILETARTWRDELQRTLPGYRERVIIVRLKSEEGGLNLAMPPQAIRRVARLGRLAAGALTNAYLGPLGDGQSETWNQHRWIRMRTTLAAAQRYVATLKPGLASGTPPYSSMLEVRPPLEPRWSDARGAPAAAALLDGLSKLASAAGESPPDLSSNGPQPMPQLHMSPPW